MRNIYLFIVFFSLNLCNAQNLNVAGVIKRSGGKGIKNAVVKLEKSCQSTITDENGYFSIINDISKQGSLKLTINDSSLNLYINERIKAEVYCIDNKFKKTPLIRNEFDSGSYSIRLPAEGDKVLKSCVVKVKGGRYIIVNRSLVKTNNRKPVQKKWSSPKFIRNTSEDRDILSVIKKGFLNHQQLIENYNNVDIEINMIENEGFLKDVDGNVYNTVKIGGQIWTVENLRTTKYNDGTSIPYVQENELWRNLTGPAFCYYNNMNVKDTIKKYGIMYNWEVINSGELAPEGWRIPNDTDWIILENFLIANGFNWDSKTRGNKIAKSIASKVGWQKTAFEGAIGKDMNKNNRTGFSAFPSGFRLGDGRFINIGCVYFWSSSSSDSLRAHSRSLYYGSSLLMRNSCDKKFAMPIRLVKK